ncbi:MAG: hypothetical protein FGM24_06235 [Candidatus Kapabacteria bacterium]|nr:hypothetical protein [Candidatus Kapabacteria bacterium]
MRYAILIMTVLVLWFAAMSAPPPQRYIWLIDRSNTGLYFEEFARQMSAGPHKAMLASGTDIATIKARADDLIVQINAVETRVGETTVTAVSTTFLEWESPTTYFYFGQYLDTYHDAASLNTVAARSADIANERLSTIMREESASFTR